MQFTGLPISTLLTMGGLAAGLITALYLLKLRKRRIEVPFSHLWGQVLARRTRDSDLWRRLRRLLSWLVHLVMAALIIFALADPHPEAEVVRGRHLLVMIDSSASMAATDVSGGVNRLDVARKRAAEVLDTVGAEDRVMLAHFNDQIQPLSPFVAEPSLLAQPLRQIELAATGTKFEEALAFAADSLRDKQDAHLVLISDGAGLDPELVRAADFDEATSIRHIQVGESAGNIAITSFNVRRYLANKLDYELFVQLRNEFTRPVDVELQLWADARLVDRKQLEMNPGETLQRFYPSQAVSGERLEARLKLLSRDARDVFPLDDRAFALLPPLRQTRVLVVSAGNLFLEGPLLLNPNLDVQRASPQEYSPGLSADVDVTIFDGVAPDTPPEGNFVYFNPPAQGPWAIDGELKDPLITRVRSSHPLMRWITLKDLNILAASHARLARGDTAVASALGRPIIATRAEGDLQLVGIFFDIRASDLPLRVAFPVLMINLVDYFALDDASYRPHYETGQTWSVPVDLDEGVAQVIPPDAEPFEAAVFEGRASFYGARTGFYEIRAAQSATTIAANLASRAESQIKPSSLPDEVSGAEAGSDLFFERSEWWIWAVLALIAITLLEWFSYNRRATV